MSVAPITNYIYPSLPPLPESHSHYLYPVPDVPLWLWQQRIPIGGITLLEGPSGIGKTLCALMLAAGVSRGMMPDCTPCPQGNVLYITHEDSALHHLGPILHHSHAYLPAIHFPPYAMDFEERALAQLVVDMEKYRPRLVVIDSVRSTLGCHSKLTDRTLTSLLYEFQKTAQHFHTAVVLIRNTDVKNSHSQQTRVEKSPHLASAARSILLLSPDSTDPGSILLSQSKSSLSTNTPTLSFRVTSDPTQPDALPSLVWSSAPNLSGAELQHLQYTNTLPRQDIAPQILAILRENHDQHLKCPAIVEALNDPEIKPNTVGQSLRRLEKRGLIENPSYGCYLFRSSPSAGLPMQADPAPNSAMPPSNSPAVSQPVRSSLPQQTVNVSNSSTPSSRSVNVSNSSTPSSRSAKVSNSAGDPGSLKTRNLVKVSNSATPSSQSAKVSNSAGDPGSLKTRNLVKVSNSLTPSSRSVKVSNSPLQSDSLDQPLSNMPDTLDQLPIPSSSHTITLSKSSSDPGSLHTPDVVKVSNSPASPGLLHTPDVVKVSNSATLSSRSAKVSNSAILPDQPVKVSNSATSPDQPDKVSNSATLSSRSAKVSNSAISPDQPAKVSNSPAAPGSLKTRKSVKVSNSADVQAAPSGYMTPNPAKVSNSPAQPIQQQQPVSNSSDVSRAITSFAQQFRSLSSDPSSQSGSSPSNRSPKGSNPRRGTFLNMYASASLVVPSHLIATAQSAARNMSKTGQSSNPQGQET